MCELPLDIKNKSIIIQLELLPATSNDLKEIDFVKQISNGEFVPVYKRRLYLPYWLKSFKTNKVESKCYFIRETTNMNDINMFLKDNRVFIHKSFKIQ